jgi:hypothetical protein
MKAREAVISMALASILLSGCVERRYVVTTDPPGAVVYVNGDQYLGATPVDNHFIYYGKTHFKIVKEGYETLQVDQELSSPWYEYPPLDFFAETLLPYTVIDRREFHYKLEPRKLPDQAQFIQQAQVVREKGLALGPGKPSGPPAPVSPPPGVPVNVSPPPGAIAPGVTTSPPPGAIFGGAPPIGSPPVVNPNPQ